MNQSRIKPARMLILLRKLSPISMDTNQEQAKTEDAKRHDKEQV